MTPIRALSALGVGVLAALLAFPSSAAAHGLVGRLDLPVPQWLFAWTAAVVLVVSFVGMSVAWREPRLESTTDREILRVPFVAEAALSGFGLLAFAAIVVAGLFGEQTPATNLAPTAVYVVFWVVVPMLSLFVGDLFAALSPWRTLGRVGEHLGLRARLGTRPYPERIGRWPAAAGLLLFAWVELAAPFGDEPRVVAILALAYAATQLAGIARYGVEPWTRNADAFGVAFTLIASMSPLHWSRRTLSWRRPLSGLAQLPTASGTVAVLCVMIGTTSFDGASQGGLWTTLTPDIVIALGDAGLSRDVAQAMVDTGGIALCAGLIAAVFAVGIYGMSSVRRGTDRRRLALRFAHSLVPIALAYVVAHYFSLVVFQGQAITFMISDPLADGSDLFGTAGAGIDLGVVSAQVIWYVQVGALVIGHVAGLLLAHDRALVTYKRSSDALQSQYWMLAVMVGYTCLGLWLLSAVGT